MRKSKSFTRKNYDVDFLSDTINDVVVWLLVVAVVVVIAIKL
jgi:hypothetical protein